MGIRNTEEWQEVRPTFAELDAWRAKYPRRSPPYRAECKACGTRIWYSGLAVGSHRKGCIGERLSAAPPAAVATPRDSSGAAPERLEIPERIEIVRSDYRETLERAVRRYGKDSPEVRRLIAGETV